MEREPCNYYKERRCMMMIAKGIEGAKELFQDCLEPDCGGWGTGCYRSKEQMETERIEGKSF